MMLTLILKKIGYISNCLSPQLSFFLSPWLSFFLSFFLSDGLQPPSVARSLRRPPFAEEEDRFSIGRNLLPTVGFQFSFRALSLSWSIFVFFLISDFLSFQFSFSFWFLIFSLSDFVFHFSDFRSFHFCFSFFSDFIYVFYYFPIFVSNFCFFWFSFFLHRKQICI